MLWEPLQVSTKEPTTETKPKPFNGDAYTISIYNWMKQYWKRKQNSFIKVNYHRLQIAQTKEHAPTNF